MHELQERILDLYIRYLRNVCIPHDGWRDFGPMSLVFLTRTNQFGYTHVNFELDSERDFTFLRFKVLKQFDPNVHNVMGGMGITFDQLGNVTTNYEYYGSTWWIISRGI